MAKPSFDPARLPAVFDATKDGVYLAANDRLGVVRARPSTAKARLREINEMLATSIRGDSGSERAGQILWDAPDLDSALTSGPRPSALREEGERLAGEVAQLEQAEKHGVSATAAALRAQRAKVLASVTEWHRACARAILAKAIEIARMNAALAELNERVSACGLDPSALPSPMWFADIVAGYDSRLAHAARELVSMGYATDSDELLDGTGCGPGDIRAMDAGGREHAKMIAAAEARGAKERQRATA